MICSRCLKALVAPAAAANSGGSCARSAAMTRGFCVMPTWNRSNAFRPARGHTDRTYRFLSEGAFTTRKYALRYMRFQWNEPLEEGLYLQKEGRPEAAEPKLAAALAIDPDNAAALAGLTRIHARRPAERPQAYAEIRRAIALEPQAAPLLALLGHLLREDGKPEEAEPLLRAALAAAPTEIHHHAVLALLLQQTGRSDE